jgi:hypothetical protein
MSAEATESAQALFITTYVVTLSTNLGGQAVTTNIVDVYLRSDAVQGIHPMAEASFLDQCVDPSSALCATSTPAAKDYSCGSTISMTYPPNGAAAAGTNGKPPTPTHSKSEVQGRATFIQLGLLVSVGTMATPLLVL